MNINWKIKGVDVVLKDVTFDHEDRVAEFGEILHNGGCICALLSQEDEDRMAREVYAWRVEQSSEDAVEAAYQRLQDNLEARA